MSLDKFLNRRNIVVSLLSAVAVAVILSIFLIQLFHIQPGCSYSRYVHEIDTGRYLAIEKVDQYRYNIDYCDYVRDAAGNIYDYFGLIQISGWEVVKQGGNWGTNMEGILLESDSFAYRVDAEMIKRTDNPYLDQSDPESRSLNVGFFTYIPSDTLPTGSYSISILVREGKEYKILLTENKLEVQ